VGWSHSFGYGQDVEGGCARQGTVDLLATLRIGSPYLSAGGSFVSLWMERRICRREIELKRIIIRLQTGRQAYL
jgi:hypothetical protein